ncbi:MAG: hypothetical protein QM803_04890 [Rhodocyclaceae bacterium]
MFDLVEVPAEHSHERFVPVTFKGDAWDFSHLKTFAFKVELEGIGVTDVVVLFSCHCFTHSFKWDDRPRAAIPADEIYDDGAEQRVLDPVRYAWSQNLLRTMVHELPQRKIIVANDEQRNFMTWQRQSAAGVEETYAVFFDVEKDKHRGRRLLLRIQSAYVLDNGLSRRQREAKKVGWHTLLKAAHEGRKIKP